MCRLAAYLGAPLSLRTFLIEPEHSLYVQSWQPKELDYAKLNVDGFGIGWHQVDGTPACYRIAQPIWSDPNLPALAASLKRDIWVAMVRSATPGYATDLHNTQPFCDAHRLFVHNGFIKNFQYKLRRAFLERIDPEIESDIKGLTDSEYIFALIRQLINENSSVDISSVLRQAQQWIREQADEHAAMLNIIISDGNSLFAMRNAINENAPSMYYLYKNNTHQIASECSTTEKEWRVLPKDTILILHRDQKPQLLPL